MFTVASSSSQPTQSQGPAGDPGTLGALEPPQEGSRSGDPILPPWTPTAANKGMSPFQFPRGSLQCHGTPPSTLLPASLGPRGGLEVLMGSPGVESFWEEAAEVEGEPALPGTPANGSAEEGEFEARGLIRPPRWCSGTWGWEEALLPPGKVSSRG